MKNIAGKGINAAYITKESGMCYKAKLIVIILFLSVGCVQCIFGFSMDEYVSKHVIEGGFCLADDNTQASIYVDSKDKSGVRRVVNDLQDDIRKVTGRVPSIVHAKDNLEGNVVIVGSIGNSELIDQLIKTGKLMFHKLSVSGSLFLLRWFQNLLREYPAHW